MKTDSRLKPRGSVLGCFAAIFLASLCIFAFLNFVEVVKFAGAPFLLIPDALGVIETVGRDEVTKVSIPNNTSTEIEISHPGDYYIYLPTWQQLDRTTIVRIQNDNGRVPLDTVRRPTLPFDTTAASGFPQYMFNIDQPGKYDIKLSKPSDGQQRELSLAIVPDYISGNEAIFAGVMGVQLLLIILVIVAFLLIRFLNRRASIAADFDRQQEKRDEMEDFVSDYKSRNK